MRWTFEDECGLEIFALHCCTDARSERRAGTAAKPSERTGGVPGVLARDVAEQAKREPRLEQEATRAANKMADAKGRAKTEADIKQAEAALRASQEKLLRVTFQIECARAQAELQAAAEAPAKRALASKKAEVVEVVTYYATNRNQTEGREATKVYGPKFNSSLHYGRAVVTIPLTHVAGKLELPTLWKLQREPDPSKHFVLKSVTPLDQDSVRNEMQEKLAATGRSAILLFVHGYNMGFPEAAMRTAQLAHDLRFAGLPFFFSWPSANQLLSYWQDEETAQISEPMFGKLLDDLSKLPATDLYIIAHSMGGRMVSQALKTRVDMAKETKHVRELLLAAPDINADLFRTVIAPKLSAMQGTRTTIYAASSDLALRASKVVHGFRRLGETTGGVFTHQGFETIDASTATQVNRAYGHLYLMDNTMVLKDVRTIIDHKYSAKQRGLSEVGQLPNIFWRLK